MTDSTALTDRKLLFLLNGPSILMNSIDPDGLLSAARLTKLRFNTEDSVWTAVCEFPEKEMLILLGLLREDGIPMVSLIKMPLPGKHFDALTLRPSETLLKSLGPLNEVPARLRRILRSPGRETAKTGGLSLRDYTGLVSQAIFWGVEPVENEEALKGFSRYIIAFDYGREPIGKRQADTVRMKLVNILDEGEITVEADADVYGLGGKKVTLIKNLGMLRKATVYCTVNKDGRDIPSLKAAFDLYGAIPALYSKERRKTIKKKPNG